MKLRFVKKKFGKREKIKMDNPNFIKIEQINDESKVVKEAEEKQSESVKNKTKKEKKDMITKEQISAIEVAAEGLKPEVKIVKKDRGLIERTESSKIIITEDNRQVLND